MSNAYWIDPRGSTVVVGDRHITEIIRSPKRFGITREWVDSIYRKYHEAIGTEGNAREKIMAGLMLRGWIRIRYVMRLDSYTFQFSGDFYDEDTWKKYAVRWVRWVLTKDPARETSVIRFIDLHGDALFPEKHLYEIAGGALYEQAKKGTFAMFLNPKRKYKL